MNTIFEIKNQPFNNMIYKQKFSVSYEVYLMHKTFSINSKKKVSDKLMKILFNSNLEQKTHHTV